MNEDKEECTHKIYFINKSSKEITQDLFVALLKIIEEGSEFASFTKTGEDVPHTVINTTQIYAIESIL